jgi:hypothetical protein
MLRHNLTLIENKAEVVQTLTWAKISTERLKK